MREKSFVHVYRRFAPMGQGKIIESPFLILVPSAFAKPARLSHSRPTGHPGGQAGLRRTKCAFI